MDPHAREVARRVNFDMKENPEIRSRVPSQEYRDNWDRIFGKKKNQPTTEEQSQ